jgi:hypothetical protein
MTDLKTLVEELQRDIVSLKVARKALVQAIGYTEWVTDDQGNTVTKEEFINDKMALCREVL